MLASADQIQHVGLSEKGAELAEYLKLLADQDDRPRRKDTLVNGVGVGRHMDGQLACQIDQIQEVDRQNMERSARQGRRQRFGKYSVRPIPKKEPNGQVHHYSITEIRRFSMLQEMRAQKIPRVTKDISKRLLIFDAMLDYEDKVKPFLKSIDENTSRGIHTRTISIYLQKKIVSNTNYSAASFSQANISGKLTNIGRAFEYAGLLKKVLADTRGRSYDYVWAIDLKQHSITREQLEWAFQRIWKDPKFQKLIGNAKQLKKSPTALDKMDKDAKEVLETVLKENERLKVELAELRNGGSSPAEYGSGTSDDNPTAAAPEDMLEIAEETDDNFGNREHAPTPTPRFTSPTELISKSSPETTGSPTEVPDPFKALDQVKDRLTRGSTIKIEITL
jgi:hypothetical protein